MGNVWNGPVRPSAMKKGISDMAKKPMGISGLLPTAKPQAAMPRQTKGLGATRANLTNARKDSLPRMKGKKAC